MVKRFGFATHHYCVVHGLAIVNSDVKDGVKSEMTPIEQPTTGENVNGSQD